MEIFGLAAWYKMNKTFSPIPVRIPISKGNTRQATNVPKPGTKSDSAKKKITSICQPKKSTLRLTFGPPHWLNDLDFNHKHHSCDDDGSQGRFWNEIKVGSEEQQGSNYEQPRVESSHRSPYAAAVVHGRSRQRSCAGVSLHEGVGDVRQADRDHFLSSVHSLPVCCRRSCVSILNK